VSSPLIPLIGEGRGEVGVGKGGELGQGREGRIGGKERDVRV